MLGTTSYNMSKIVNNNKQKKMRLRKFQEAKVRTRLNST